MWLPSSSFIRFQFDLTTRCHSQVNLLLLPAFRFHTKVDCLTRFDFFMNAIHHIYSINEERTEKVRVKQWVDLIAKQSQIECSNVWRVVSGRNNDGNKWMSLHAQENHYRLNSNCNHANVNRNRCRKLERWIVTQIRIVFVEQKKRVCRRGCWQRFHFMTFDKCEFMGGNSCVLTRCVCTHFLLAFQWMEIQSTHKWPTAGTRMWTCQYGVLFSLVQTQQNNEER